MTPTAAIHVRSEQSADAVSVIEVTAESGFEGPPPHHHAFVHTLANISGGPARYLLISTPGGFEARFEEGGLGSAVGEKPYLVTHMVGPTIPEYLSSAGAGPVA